ncbi:hypothetical protein K2Y11_05080 [bacterium]|nr:hypothetical protein [bacterium]
MPNSSATTNVQSIPNASSPDDWMEDLLLAGVKASVRSIPSPNPVRAKLLAEPPMPTWAEEMPTSELLNDLVEMENPTANFDDEPANTKETAVESSSSPSNVEMSHLLIDEVDEVPGDHDRLVDNTFHGLNENLDDDESDSDIDVSAELEVSNTATVLPEVAAYETDDAWKEAESPVADDSSKEAAVHVPNDIVTELTDSNEVDDLVAAEIALALKQVEEEAAERSVEPEDLLPAPASVPKNGDSESADMTATFEQEEAPGADQNESLSQEAISSLLAKFDDEDELPTATNTPKESAPKVTCPAGTPQPKINLAALKKKGGDEAPALAARLFGEGGESAKASEGEGDVDKNVLTGIDEKPKERQLPVILVALDRITDRLRLVHPMIPAALGILGGFLAVNGILAAVLASLGWI